ncbi:MAG: organic hydroperoxide resistance protein, partial [Lysobacteraceae bacterium]
PADARITGKVGIGPIPNGFGIRVELVVSLPGVDRETAHTIVERAHVVCPYSNATRGNVEVTFTLA